MRTIRAPQDRSPERIVPDIVPQFGPAVERPTLWDAVRKHPLLVIIPAVFGAVAGAVAGHSKAPVFTASVPMVITQGNSTQVPGALNGYATAAPELADAYSRMVTAQAVSLAIRKQVHLTQQQLAARVSAGPVPGSPVLYVHGQGASAQAAIRLANTASAELVRFVRLTTAPNPGPKKLLDEYTRSQNGLQGALNKQAAARGAYTANHSKRNRTHLIKASAAVQSAQLRTSSLENAYRDAESNSVAATDLRVLAPASKASSNRLAEMELLGALGTMAGLVLGMALAAVVGKMEWRRASHPKRL